MKLCIALLLLLLSAPARAEPFVLLVFEVAGLLTSVAVIKTLFFVAVTAYGSAHARRKARKAQAAAKADYLANLQDRSITALQALPPWRVIYGRCITGGDPHAIFTTDKSGYREDGTAYTRPDALKHIVIVFADHEVQAIHEIYIDGVALGTLDGSGFVTGGEFYTVRKDSRTATIGGGGSVTVAQPVVDVLQAYVRDGTGEGGNFTPVSVTLSGGNLTINGAAGAIVDYTVANDLPSVRVQKHLGTSTQTVDTYLNSVVPSEWTSTDRLLDKAYIVLTLDLENTRFQGGPPGITADISGRKLYDPRKDSTNGGSGSHRTNNPATWEWSNNTALVIRDDVTAAWGFEAPQDDVNDAFTITAANACDVRQSASAQSYSATFTASASADTITFTVDRIFGVGDGVRFTTTGTLPGGLSLATTYYIVRLTDARTFKLATSFANAMAGTTLDITSAGTGTHTCTWHDYATYTINGAITTDEAKEAVLDDMAEAMAGFAVYGAEWELIAGAWTATVMDLTDDDLAGQIEIVQADVGLDQLLNGVRGSFIPIGKATPVEFDNYSNSTFVTADGRELWEDRALPFTDNKIRARNLCRIFVERGRNGQILRYPAKLKAWPLQRGDRIRVSSTEYGLALKSYRVTDWQFGGPASPVILTLQEDDSTVYDLADAATADPTQNTGLPSPWVVQQLSTVAATSGLTTGLLASDGSWQPRVRVTWAAVTGAYLADGAGRILVLWRDPRASEWQKTEVASNETGAWITGIREGDPLVIEVAAINGLGQYGPPSFLSHTVTVTQQPSTYQGTTLVAHGTSGALSIIGNSVIKVTSGGAWNAGVYSKAPITAGCRVSFRVAQANKALMVGLNTDPTTDANYTSIDHAIHLSGTGTVEIYESGTNVAAAGSYSASDEFAIEYDDTAVRYYKGATLLRQLAVDPGKTLYLDSSFEALDGRVTNIEFRALSAAPRGNLIDTSTWVIGSNNISYGSSGGNRFNHIGQTGEDEVLLAAGCDAVQKPIWRATSQDVVGSSGDGGWDGGNVPIDHTKLYRWVVKFKPASAVDAQFFLGCLANSVASIATGTPDANPYFANENHQDLVPGRYYLVSGYVLPSTYGTTPPSPTLGGWYDMATGQRVKSCVDFKWVSGITESNLRSYLYYGVSGASQDWDNDVRLEMVDSTTPTIEELIAPAKRALTNQLLPDFESQYTLNGQFSNWALGASVPDGWTSAGGTNSRETTITRTGPNAVRSTSATATAGITKTISLGGLALAAGSFIEGTLDAYLVSHTSGGYPGLWVRLYTNSGLSTQRDVFFDLPNTTTGGWQTIPFKAAVNSGERIYGVEFNVLSSSSNFSGGQGVSTVIFDSLVAKAVQPSDKDHLVQGAVTTFPTAGDSFVGSTWTNSAADYNPQGTFPSVGFTLPGHLSVVHEARNGYTFDINVKTNLRAHSTSVVTITCTMRLVYRNVTTSGNAVALRTFSIQQPTFIPPSLSTQRHIDINVNLSGSIVPGFGLVVGDTYQFGLYFSDIAAWDSSGTQIAPGASSDVNLGGHSRLLVTTS